MRMGYPAGLSAFRRTLGFNPNVLLTVGTGQCIFEGTSVNIYRSFSCLPRVDFSRSI